MSVLPEQLSEVFAEAEKLGAALDINALWMQVRRLQAEDADDWPEDDLRALRAEQLALCLLPRRGNPERGWGRYFGPRFWIDGVEIPEAAEVDEWCLDYWEQRAEEAKDPQLVARYADAVWDVTSAGNDHVPRIDAVRLAIPAYLKAGTTALPRGVRRDCLLRALDLSIATSSPASVEEAVDACIDLAKESDDEHLGIQVGIFIAVRNSRRKIERAEERIQELAGILEARLRGLLAATVRSKSPLDMHTLTEQLARHYIGRDQPEEARRLIGEYAEVIEQYSRGGSALTARGWVDDALRLCQDMGVKVSADRLFRRLGELGQESQEEMVRFAQPITITAEEEAQFRAEAVEGGLGASINRVAQYFLPDRNKEMESLKESAQNTRLLHLIETQLVDGKHVRGRVGGVIDDPEGSLARHLCESMKFQAPFLHLVFEEIIRRYRLTGEDLASIVCQHGAADDDHRAIFISGMRAYCRGDYIDAIHVLIPQVEHVVRKLLDELGGETSCRKQDVFEERNFGAVLQDEVLVAGMDPDLRWYLRVLFTEKAGWNLRNLVCHGLPEAGRFTFVMADRVVHALLALAREVALISLRAEEAEAGAPEPPDVQDASEENAGG